MLHIHKPDRDTSSALAQESRLVYDWFAGWRWERYRGGELIDESLENFATRAECVADAKRHRAGAMTQEHELTELAA